MIYKDWNQGPSHYKTGPQARKIKEIALVSYDICHYGLVGNILAQEHREYELNLGYKQVHSGPDDHLK